MRRNIAAEVELATKAMVEIVVLVRNLSSSGFMGMFAMFGSEFGYNMLKRVNGLKQYGGPNCNNQRNIQ